MRGVAGALAPYLVIGALIAVGLAFGGEGPRRPPIAAAPEVIRGGERSEVIAGRARVVDGDTLAVRGRRIRLDGIDALELSQLCDSPRGRYACGREAARALDALIGGDTVACRAGAADRYRRLVAVCRANGRDLGAALVAAGWALASRGGAYAAQEREARAARRGVWQGDFQPPAEWRRRHRE
jgi:endonuclease YncB( thermonuclease family)